MLPLLVLLLVAIIQFGIIFGTYLSLNHAALVGARAAAVATSNNATVGTTEAKKAASAFIKNTAALNATASPTTVNSEGAWSVTVTYNLQPIFGGTFSAFGFSNPYAMSATAVMRN
jgi:Flp pilus assembly protein TadG